MVCMNKKFLNARHLLCPLPVIRVQDKVKQMRPEDLLEVVCTDPGVMQDIPAWCRINGHKVINKSDVDSEYTLVIKVGKGD